MTTSRPTKFRCVFQGVRHPIDDDFAFLLVWLSRLVRRHVPAIEGVQDFSPFAAVLPLHQIWVERINSKVGLLFVGPMASEAVLLEQRPNRLIKLLHEFFGGLTTVIGRKVKANSTKRASNQKSNGCRVPQSKRHESSPQSQNAFDGAWGDAPSARFIL